jgi:hypothetical protein
MGKERVELVESHGTGEERRMMFWLDKKEGFSRSISR